LNYAIIYIFGAMFDIHNIRGLAGPALWEIHIFMGELNPSEADFHIFEKMVNDYNEVYKPAKLMKAPWLALNYKDIGYVTILQSSRYFVSDDYESVVKEAHNDEEYFKLTFSIKRVKIELSMHGNINMPKEPTQYYFEHHIKLEINDNLEHLSAILTEKYKVPIPTSYNKNKKGNQKFLNFRQRNISTEDALLNIKNICQYISQYCKVICSIDEMVVYDTCVEMDQGWID